MSCQSVFAVAAVLWLEWPMDRQWYVPEENRRQGEFYDELVPSQEPRKQKQRAQTVKDNVEYAVHDAASADHRTSNSCWDCCCGDSGVGGGFDGLFDAPVPRALALPSIFVSPGFSLMRRE